MSTHAPAAPSSLHRIIPCAASLTLERDTPPLPMAHVDEAAQEGTDAHMVAMAHVMNNPWPAGTVGTREDGTHFTADVDMVNGAAMFSRSIREAGGEDVRTEDAVRISAIHPQYCYGTPDVWWRAETTSDHEGPSIVNVWDYKYGHKFVDVWMNAQCLGYAFGVAERLNITDPATIFRLGIVQPRSYHPDGPVRVWKTTMGEMHSWLAMARDAVEQALKPGAFATTGEHCADCRARHVCTTLGDTTHSLMDYSKKGEARELSGLALGQELRWLESAMERLEARTAALRVKAEHDLRAGVAVPFYHMEPQKARLKWHDVHSADALAMIGDVFGVNIRKPPGVMTPAQAVAAGLAEEAVAAYADRGAGFMKLKQVDTTAIRKLLGTA